MEPDDEFLTIGTFGRLVGLTPSALRFYDDCGVLRPAMVDPSSGYRHYTRGQVARARLLRRLREACLPLAEAKVVLDGSVDEARRVLTAHREAIEARLGPARQAITEVLQTLSDAPVHWGLTICGPELASAFRQVAPAAAVTGDFPALACVLVEVRHDELVLVATDRYRLSMRVLTAHHSFGPARQLPVPTAELAKIAAVAARHEHVHMTGTDEGVSVTLGGQRHPLTVAPVEFPDYRAILAKLAPPTTRAIVERSALADLLVDSGLPDVVSIVIGEDRVRVQAPGREDMVFDAICTGTPMVVGFAPAVLGAAVDASIGADVMLELAGPDQAVIIRSADQGAFTTLAMPTLLTAA